MSKIPFHALVTPKDPEASWQLGHVTGMSRFDLSIGPLLHVRDIISGKLIMLFPMHIDQLVRKVS